MRTMALTLVPALLSCTAPAGEAPDSVPAPSPAAADEVTGVVRVVGSAPVDVQVVVQRENGGDVLVVGPMRSELRRLSGAEVVVSGAVEDASHPAARRQVRATDYRILRVNGQPVVEGTVEGKSGDWTVLRTPGGERVYLASAPADLTPGRKVWVQGPRSVVVQSYGVVRE